MKSKPLNTSKKLSELYNVTKLLNAGSEDYKCHLKDRIVFNLLSIEIYLYLYSSPCQQY